MNINSGLYFEQTSVVVFTNNTSAGYFGGGYNLLSYLNVTLQ